MIPGCVGMNTINNRSHRLGEIVEEVLLVPAPKDIRMDVQLINKVSALPVADRTDIALCMADIFWHAKASAVTHPDPFAEYCALLLSVPFCHQAEIERQRIMLHTQYSEKYIPVCFLFGYRYNSLRETLVLRELLRKNPDQSTPIYARLTFLVSDSGSGWTASLTHTLLASDAHKIGDPAKFISKVENAHVTLGQESLDEFNHWFDDIYSPLLIMQNQEDAIDEDILPAPFNPGCDTLSSERRILNTEQINSIIRRGRELRGVESSLK